MPLSPGDKLGRYELLALIGKGGMGEVWRARDPRLNREVAIKCSLVGLGRFQQEAEAIAALNHPHICQIYDVGADYLVMELIDGQPLSDRIKAGPVPLASAVRIATQIASALEAAHKKGILHRDLKPANVLVTQAPVTQGDIQPWAKLLDFGLAKMTLSGDEDETARTIDGAVLGTAPYMSPEQAQGKQLDERSDIFSFGAVLYEMLSGKRAFGGGSMADVLSAVIRDDPAALDSPLSSLVKRCLAKRREERYAGMAEVRIALENAAPEKIASNPAPSQQPAPSQPSIAVLPFANMSRDPDDEYFSDGLAEEIINLLAQIPGLRVIARTSAFAFRGKEQDIRGIAEALGVTTVLEGSVRRSGNRIRVTAQLISADNGSHLFSERYDREMADVFALQDELAAAITAVLKVKLAGQPGRRQYTPGIPAYDAVLKARHYFYQLTPDGMARAQEYLRQAIALDPGYAAPHSELGLVFNALANFGITPAHDVIPLARAEARHALELDPLQVDALALLGYIAANYDYDWKEAGRLFGLAREHGQISPIARSRYARYLGALGRAAEDVEECERILADDPLSSYFRMSLAYALLEVGRYENAAQECRRLLELDENYHMSWAFLSEAAWSQGKLEEALSAAERAVSLAPWNLVNQGMLAALCALNEDEGGAAEALRKLGDGTAYLAPVGFYLYFLIRGEIDQAADWAAKGIGQRMPLMVNFLRAAIAAPLRRSPRWPALAKMMNLPEAV